MEKIINYLILLFWIAFPIFIIENGQEFFQNHFPKSLGLVYTFIFIACCVGLSFGICNLIIKKD
jgi:hypothetical protein